VVFPFGKTKKARYEEDLGLWTVRFLIPRDTPDGPYSISIIATLQDGKQKHFQVSYTVDTATPTFKLAILEPIVPGKTVTLSARQIITEKELKQAPGYTWLRRNRTRRLYAQMMKDARKVQVRAPSGQLILLKQKQPGLWTGKWHVPATLTLTQSKVEVIATDLAGNCSMASHPIQVSP